MPLAIAIGVVFRLQKLKTPSIHTISDTMKISYDKEIDALSIIFFDATITTEHVAEGIAVEYDTNGNLAGIEILDAVERFGNTRPFEHVILEGVGALQRAA
jgi:uncharacterized protein YuzE